MPASSASPELRTKWRATLPRAPLRMWIAERAGAQQSPCPHKREGGPVVLPREVVDGPRAHDQVARQPVRSCPIRGGGGRRLLAELLSREPQLRAVKA
eukprot:14848484-Alexandrium_andersonii.AAC.1